MLSAVIVHEDGGVQIVGNPSIYRIVIAMRSAIPQLTTMARTDLTEILNSFAEPVASEQSGDVSETSSA